MVKSETVFCKERLIVERVAMQCINTERFGVLYNTSGRTICQLSVNCCEQTNPYKLGNCHKNGCVCLS